MKTEQEEFWLGDFGDKYALRNSSSALLESNISLFSEIISKTNNVESIIEFGANIGLNLRALRTLCDSYQLSGVEINSTAFIELSKMDGIEAYNESILDFEATQKYDFVLSKTVLIHINPEHIQNVYNKIYEASSKYICLIEYYNPVPITINYRGHENKLFKRDFAGEMMDQFPDLSLIDYGFKYHRDNNFPQDDVTWFLMEKSKKHL